MSWICAQALLGGLWAAQSQPSSSALPTDLVTVANPRSELLPGLMLHYCYTLGFSLLTAPHLGLFLLWVLIFLNMSMSNVCMSLYSLNLLYLFNIHWNICWDIDWEDLVSCLKKCNCSTGNKHNVLLSFLCELASPIFIKIYLCYLLCKISCWVKVFKVWCFPPTPINPRSLRTFWENPYKPFSRQSRGDPLK